MSDPILSELDRHLDEHDKHLEQLAADDEKPRKLALFGGVEIRDEDDLRAKLDLANRLYWAVHSTTQAERHRKQQRRSARRRRR